MHVHILGIGGTFMAGVARLAVELGHRVTGSDANLYPPMSDQLHALGVDVHLGYGIEPLRARPDIVVVGNALSRGNACVEYLLDESLPYTSGPAWLHDHVLPGRHVIAVAGTHGKTTTSSLVAWMLEHAGLAPGFLVGGVVENFGVSARLGAPTAPFVVEADEYDTAFFDKRSKFLHYAPRTLLINNLEYDHADIFPDLAAIQRQFHHVVRLVPASGAIVHPAPDANIVQVLAQGCWSRVVRFGAEAPCEWRYAWQPTSESPLVVRDPYGADHAHGTPLLGAHNAHNTVAALAAVAEVGVPTATGLAALAGFASVKRRLELRGTRRGVAVYDDFAHHPTAIAATIAALRSRVTPPGRILAVSEMRSNTMRMGVHRDALARAFAAADLTYVVAPSDLPWDLGAALAPLPSHAVFGDTASLIDAVAGAARPGDAVLVMSNGGFERVHERLLEALGDSA